MRSRFSSRFTLVCCQLPVSIVSWSMRLARCQPHSGHKAQPAFAKTGLRKTDLLTSDVTAAILLSFLSVGIGWV